MKLKHSILGILITSSAVVYAQKSAVNSAKSDYEKYVVLKTSPDLADPLIKTAKASIDKAVVNEKTSSDPQAWTYRALIYGTLAQSAKEGENATLLNEAATALKKARELDAAGTYSSNLKEAASLLHNYQLQRGNTLYESKDYTGAYTEFNKGLEYMPGDTTANFAAGLSALYAKDYANSLERFKELTKTNYSNLEQVYANMSYAYIIQKDTASAIKILSEGAARFPGNTELATREIEYSLMTGREKEAIAKITAQAQKNPSNKLYPYYLGIAYATTKDFPKAEEAYKKALAIDPKYSDAAINLGGLIMNSGINTYNAANKLPASKTAEFSAMRKKAMAEFDRALPYLQLAAELNPKSEMALSNLKKYYQLNNNTAKVAEIDAKIKAIK